MKHALPTIKVHLPTEDNDRHDADSGTNNP